MADYKFIATITACKYYNSDTNWGVFIFSTENDIPYLIQQSSSDMLFNDIRPKSFGTLAGNMQELIIGAKYNVVANTSESKFGMQYNPLEVYAIAPKSEDDQKMFLQSLVSVKVAENIVKEYPNVINRVMNGELKKLDYKKVKGVGEKTWTKIRNKIIDNYVISDIIAMLKPLGVTFNTIRALTQQEKNPALLKEKLEKNPYILTELRGFGFKRVDDFVLKLKPQMACSFERLVAFSNYYFKELGNSTGDTWVKKDVFVNEVISNISECEKYLEKLFASDRYIFIDSDDRIGLKSYYDTELSIYKKLKDKVYSEDFFVIEDNVIDEAIKEAEEIQGFQYTDEQRNSIYKVLNHNVSIITGSAGCGKSSVMRAIMTAIQKSNRTFSACALSAMASKRISEASGFEASTIHRTLGYNGLGFDYCEEHPMYVDYIILDEGSMVGATLFKSLIDAISEKTKVIISGDHKQLPPIGYGNIFSDLIRRLPKDNITKFTKPMRQALESGILEDAILIRKNKNPIYETTIEPKMIHGNLQDMYYMFRNDRETLNRVAIKTYINTVKREGIENVVIEVPRKQGCLNSTTEMNNIIQDILLKDVPSGVKYGNKEFKIGSKVLQIANNYEHGVFNGDVGYVRDIYFAYEKDENTDKEVQIQIVKVEFTNVKDINGNNKIVEYKKKNLSELDLGYALTIHKLQGGASATSICVVDNTHYSLLDNCMLYTMLTRAKKKCLLLAEPSAFKTCIVKSKNRRNTWLSIS